MKHTFLVAENHFGRLYFHQSFQTIIADDDAAIEVVEVGCCKTSSIQRHQRTKLWRCHGNNLHDHPLGTVDVFAGTECLYHLQTLQGFRLSLLCRVVIGTVAQLV